MYKHFPVLVAAFLVIAAVFVACGDDDEDQGESGTPTAGAPTLEPTGEADAGTEYPLTVRDMLGREVTIEAAPEAVAALSPTTVEFVYAVGGASLTRTSSVKYPEAAVGAEDIGPSYQPNLELVAAAGPDLIVADAMSQPHLAGDFEALGVPVLFVGVGVWDDVAAGLELVGKVLDESAAAEEAIAALEETKAELVSKLPAERPKVLMLNGSAQDFYAAKPESYVGDLAAILGVENPAAGAPDTGQFPGYTKLSLESIVAAEPEVVLGITAGAPGGPTITGILASDPAWAAVPAVESERVSEISVELFLQAPGPRAGEALKELARLLYPEVFGS